MQAACAIGSADTRERQYCKLWPSSWPSLCYSHGCWFGGIGWLFLLCLGWHDKPAGHGDYSVVNVFDYKFFQPTTVGELQEIVKTTKGPLSIAGGKFSQGGHIYTDKGTVIDITKLNQIISLDPAFRRSSREAICFLSNWPEELNDLAS